jgi:hypothetical protein
VSSEVPHDFLGPIWVPPPRPLSTLMSVMSSVHRTSGTLGDITTASPFDGKEGVIRRVPPRVGRSGPRYATLWRRAWRLQWGGLAPVSRSVGAVETGTDTRGGVAGEVVGLDV